MHVRGSPMVALPSVQKRIGLKGAAALLLKEEAATAVVDGEPLINGETMLGALNR